MIFGLFLLLLPIVMPLCFKTKNEKKTTSSTENLPKNVTKISASPAALTTRPSSEEKKTTAEEIEERAALLAQADTSNDAFPPKRQEEQEKKTKDVQKVQIPGERKQQTPACPPSNDMLKFRTAESPKQAHNADASMSARDKSNKWWSSKEVMKNSEYFGDQSTQSTPTNTPRTK